MALIRSTASIYDRCLYTLPWANEKKDTRNTISFPNPCVVTNILQLCPYASCIKQGENHSFGNIPNEQHNPSCLQLSDYLDILGKGLEKVPSDTFTFYSEHSPLKLRMLIQILLSTKKKKMHISHEAIWLKTGGGTTMLSPGASQSSTQYLRAFTE